jgi:HprK-related kinase A
MSAVNTVGALSRAALAERLAAGLYLQTGPFVTCVRSRVPLIVDGLARLYPDYPISDSGYADFHLTINRPAGLRRWFRPQVCADFDGMMHFLPMPLAHAFPMFEWMMNWCISSRVHRYLLIHAAVLEQGGRAVILPAPPGSGKSTLCAILVDAGWRLLSDELALIDIQTGLLRPVPRPISLKNNSIDVVRRRVPDAVMSPPVHDTIKGTVAHWKAPTASIARADEAALPAWIIYPRYKAGAALALTPMPRARSMMQLADNAFNYSVLGETGFKLLGEMVERCDSYSFVYSDIDEAVAAFSQLAARP